MHLSPTRYTKIEGTEVMVTVNSSAEAKTALKELNHKKRELAHLKRGLLREQRSMQRQRARASRPRPAVWRIFDPKKKLVRAVTAIVEIFRPQRAARATEEIARDLTRIEALGEGIESCKLQIQGKLINLG